MTRFVAYLLLLPTAAWCGESDAGERVGNSACDGRSGEPWAVGLPIKCESAFRRFEEIAAPARGLRSASLGPVLEVRQPISEGSNHLRFVS